MELVFSKANIVLGWVTFLALSLPFTLLPMVHPIIEGVNVCSQSPMREPISWPLGEIELHVDFSKAIQGAYF